MLAETVAKILGVGIVLAVVCAGVDAQETVYKWVDKDGVVHFSDAPPDESEAAESEILITEKPPAYVAPAQPLTSAPVTSETVGDNQTAQAEIEVPPLVRKPDIAAMSLEGLDRRCEDARENMIAPLRAAEIGKCKQQEDADPAWCERFYADYGNAGKTPSGTFRPRMFHDLPECIEAEQERRARSR